jgi:hypothetical protein
MFEEEATVSKFKLSPTQVRRSYWLGILPPALRWSVRRRRIDAIRAAVADSSSNL